MEIVIYFLIGVMCLSIAFSIFGLTYKYFMDKKATQSATTAM